MRVLIACLLGSILLAGGCNEAGSGDPKAAIQSAIEAHLKQRQNLMLANMTLEVQYVKVTGDTAQAEVKFRSKQSADLIVGVRYTLKRAGEGWQVESSSPTGGMGTSPHGGAGAPATAPAPAESPLKSSH
ncbi:MAG: hypothetical protein ACRD3I_05125 [Terriglobales bacterium]